MKKIFLESHNLKNRNSGFGVFNYELIKALSKQNLDDLEVILLAKNKNVMQQEFGKQFTYRRYFSHMRNKLLRFGGHYDIFHSLNQNTKIEPRHRPNKYLMTVHDVNFAEEGKEDYNEKRVKLFKEKLDKSDYLTFISEFSRKQTAQYFDIEHIPNQVIYNGNSISEIYNLENFEPRYLPSKPFLFSIGVFMDKKNFISLIEMMRLEKDKILLLAGNDQNAYGEMIKSKIDQYQLQDKVILLGKISEHEKQYYMKNCEAFLFPSKGEGFGLPPLEAMTFGKPIFLSNLTSLPEVGGEEAFYWENFDPEEMKNVLDKGIQNFNVDKEKCAKIIAQSQKFCWSKAAQQYLELYRKL